MERPELSDDPRFVSIQARKANESELRAEIEPWTSTRDHLTLQDSLQIRRVPAGAVLNAVELLDNPHVKARGTFSYVDTPAVGMGPVTRAAFTLDETPVHPITPAPEFGRHNDYVLRDLLALAPESIQRLRDTRIVTDEPIPNE